MPATRLGPAVLTACLLAAAPAIADAPSIAEQTVNAMNAVWGKHAGMRANHAKGIVVEGTFTASKQAAALSKAEMFNGATIQVTARFSNSTGIPNIPDGNPNASPHGFSIRFHQKAGDVDFVENSLKFFPFHTIEEFHDFLVAVAQTGPTTAKPTPVDQFIAAHPAAPKAFASVATPSSYSRETYNGVNAFFLINEAGKRQAVRFQEVPFDGTQHIADATAAKKTANFLEEELPKRLARGPIKFHLIAILATPTDDIKDGTTPWPDSNKRIDLGTITITQVDANSDATQKTLLFLPGDLTAGIEPSDDPLIDARNQAYAVSFGRRSQ